MIILTIRLLIEKEKPPQVLLAAAFKYWWALLDSNQ